jgi:hypothetical protein
MTSVAVPSYLAAQLYRRPSCSLMSVKCAVTVIVLMPDNVVLLLEGWPSNGGEAERRTQCSGNNSPVTGAKRVRLRICSTQLRTLLLMQITVLHCAYMSLWPLQIHLATTTVVSNRAPSTARSKRRSTMGLVGQGRGASPGLSKR